MKQIEINNLLWDTENLTKNGETYFTCDEALAAAKEIGKRLPTKEEFEALASLGSTWDRKLRGRWFGEDSKLKEKSEMSVFFPASGYRSYDNGALFGVGYNGFYWSSSVDDDSYTSSLSFDSYGVYPALGPNRAWGHSVRCVKDINN
jgi:uncharacterized protein (TIGR02145 family)